MELILTFDAPVGYAAVQFVQVGVQMNYERAKPTRHYKSLLYNSA
jgi:hypothetical protein